jgi:hypothetical protein
METNDNLSRDATSAPVAATPQGAGPSPAPEPSGGLSDSRDHDLPPLGGVADAVRSIIAAAEETARAVLDDATDEARRKVDDTHARLEELWRERSAQIRGLTESVATQGQELQSQIEQLRGQARALSTSMRRAVESLRAEFGEGQMPAAPPVLPDEPEREWAGPGGESEFDHEDEEAGIEAIAPFRKWFGIGSRPGPDEPPR